METYQIFTDDTEGLFPSRLDELYSRVSGYLEEENRQGRQLRYTKVFLSDIENQEHALRASKLMQQVVATANHTVIQQSPLNGAKIGLLLKTSDEPEAFLFHSLRLTDEEVVNFGSYVQTVMLFEKYQALLAQQGLSLSQHCLRTWIYVRDIDTNYDGVVKARNDIFRQQGLTAETHYIASTGIGGRASGRNVAVAIDFLACPKVEPQDVLYLKALDHLNPTHEYGVAFERGTRVCLPGRQQFFISGTASINNKGEVVHVGDVKRQTAHLLGNIAALLADGGASMTDVDYFVVYVRDIADAPVVDAYMQQAYPGVPRIVTYANVCRPAWLVEMECIASKAV